MSRLLLLAATTGYQTRAFGAAAAFAGIDVVLATDRCHILENPWGDAAIAVRFEEPEIAADTLAAETYDGIVALADRPTLIAALTAQRLGIPYHSPAAVRACRDKHAARELMRVAGLPVPEYFLVAVDGDIPEAARRAHYPCVLKPLGLSASRGVIRANDEAEFAAAFRRIRAILEVADHSRSIQVESFIEGSEFALEGLVTAGKLRTLAVFDKPDPLDGPFFEESIYVTPARVDTAPLIATTEKAVAALGLTDGPIHAEMRANATGVYMLEVAARPIGGLCAKSLRFNDGMSLEELVIRHALGEDTSQIRREAAASGVMMIPIPMAGVYEGVIGVEGAAATPCVEDVVITAKQGQTIVPLPEGASYLGFIFARAQTADEVEQALRKAHAQLRFEIAVTLPVMK